MCIYEIPVLAVARLGWLCQYGHISKGQPSVVRGKFNVSRTSVIVTYKSKRRRVKCVSNHTITSVFIPKKIDNQIPDNIYL